MTMNPNRGVRSVERGTFGPSETSERYYMNKAFGRSLERAKALDGQPGRSQEEPSEVQRAMIEPDARGGHMVTIERLFHVAGNGRAARQTQDWFPEVESAIQFLHRVLCGGRPEDGTSGELGRGQTGNAGRLQEENKGRNAGHTAVLNELVDAGRDLA